MKHQENIKKIIQRVYTQNSNIPEGKAADERILGDALTAMEDSKRKKPVRTGTIIGSFFMKNKTTKYATAVVLIVAVLLLISIPDKSISPAYAVEQTVEAIRKIETVYMEGEFYKQGRFECWMQFEGDPDRPTHVWLGRKDWAICKICSPDGVFSLNKPTNRVHFNTRDERGKIWIPKFNRLFKESLEKAPKSDAVEIIYDKNPETDQDIIIVNITTTNRTQKLIVDPVTKLPTSFETVRDDQPMEMMRKTLAVKNLWQIRYNQQPPEGIFDLPADAVVVENEVDCLVDPDSGLIADGMTQEQACLEIVKQTGQALVELDQVTLCKLDLFFRLYPPQIWEQLREMKETGQWVKEVSITGEPYSEGELWFVPLEIRGPNDQNEVQNAMIKFYELKGKTFCFIIGSKEKGVVD